MYYCYIYLGFDQIKSIARKSKISSDLFWKIQDKISDYITNHHVTTKDALLSKLQRDFKHKVELQTLKSIIIKYWNLEGDFEEYCSLYVDDDEKLPAYRSEKTTYYI